MLRVVFDTNVYVSAMNFSGIPNELLRRTITKEVKLFASEEIFAELYGVLTKKFQYPPRRIADADEFLRGIATVVHPKHSVSVVKERIADNRILECSVSARADYLVTGDKRHLLPIRKFRGVRIVTPAEFLSILDIHKT
jgi:putative PIN family toxin of toxin-antitoxin system